jgi:antirestriction protein ArdC
METTEKRRDVYAIVTERIIEQLEKGTIPWKQSWTNAGIPQNLVTGKKYKGINIILLNSLGYKQNLFLTRKQLEHFGGEVLPNEKPNIVVFWNWNKQEDNSPSQVQEEELLIEGHKRKKPVLRFYRVFNVSQCVGITEDTIPVITRPNDPIQACEDILEGMSVKPEIVFNEPKPFYDTVEDEINMPEMERFDNSESYYDTLFHEIIHWTGHKKRLNRPEITKNNIEYGSPEYTLEELTAEIGASFLGSMTGIAEKVEEDNTAYIKQWLKVLKNDRKYIVIASSKAQKGVEYILNEHKTEREVDDPEQSLKENASK